MHKSNFPFHFSFSQTKQVEPIEAFDVTLRLISNVLTKTFAKWLAPTEFFRLKLLSRHRILLQSKEVMKPASSHLLSAGWVKQSFWQLDQQQV